MDRPHFLWVKSGLSERPDAGHIHLDLQPPLKHYPPPALLSAPKQRNVYNLSFGS